MLTRIPPSPPSAATSRDPCPDAPSATATTATTTTSSNLATPTVRVLLLQDRQSASNAQVMQAQAKAWAARSGLVLEYTIASASTTYPDYVAQVRRACYLKQAGAYDVLWFKVQHVGYLSSCLAALNATATAPSPVEAGMSDDILANGLLNGTLYALPAETYTSLYYYNKDKLREYNFDQAPENMDELEVVMRKIIRDARAGDNYGLSGLAGPFQREW
jgi:ABC-type glycerol-3-phosphate transport system substrate-binding protein